MAAHEGVNGAAGPDGGFEERVRWLLAVPHVAVFSSVVDDSGTWVRRAEYPEIPGCVVEAPSAVEAADLLEELRVRLIVAGCRDGGPGPLVDRPALPGGTAGLSGLTVEEVVRRL
ncbi:hypothetical protein [Streptomyces sp. NPDC050560]|uniref:hypothetical protein n=1 Tax=Streptomyces sp. NPDC050560 TaxID=3365630 RepID=UPI0037BD3607